MSNINILQNVVVNRDRIAELVKESKGSENMSDQNFTSYRAGSDYITCLTCGEFAIYEDWDKSTHQMLFGDSSIVGYYKCPNTHLTPISRQPNPLDLEPLNESKFSRFSDLKESK